MRPLRGLSATAQAIANGNLWFRAECNGLPEIENVARFRLFFEHSPAVLAMLDREIRYLAVNRLRTKDYQLDKEQILGRSHYEVFPDLQEHRKAVRRRYLAGAGENSDHDDFRRGAPPHQLALP